MTETDVSAEPQQAPQKSGGLSAKLMPELKQIAAGLGIRSTGMKKADLVGAIRAAQSSGSQNTSSQNTGGKSTGDRSAGDHQSSGSKSAAADRSAGTAPEAPRQDRLTDRQPQRRVERTPDEQPQASPEQTPPDQQHDKQNGQPNGQPAPEEEGGSRRNRRRRGRDRTDRNDRNERNERTERQPSATTGRQRNNEPDTSILEDDVLSPCAGILDVLDNYAFVRTTGYLPGPDDVYVSLSMVRKLGLRRGDAITGQVRQPREGERKEKFNPLVKIDSVNGGDPEASRERVEFDRLTPVDPGERLRMETTRDNLTGRAIDVVAPIGKGQRGLVLAPAGSGRTTVLKAIAAAVTANHPECHVMVVLVDERPEEVTDFERSVTGEIISSTFDRPAADHTVVAELAIERAKRLVELGHDVVVLLDGLTRLGRAYSQAAPTSGRAVQGAVDPASLHPAKRFFGAARNVEGGGSLTIIASATIESGSTTDEVILEEFAGTANMELRLRREAADRRVFPAVDAVASGTRHEELLLSPEELAASRKLRRQLADLAPQQALELLLGRLAGTQK